MYYFSYGSNMSVRRLLQRISAARRVGTGRLSNHTIRFHKVGKRDGTGKCDVFETGCPEDGVYGVVYTVPEREKLKLDGIEGVGLGYEKKTVVIELGDGSRLEASTYYATHIDPGLKPLDWYKEHVLRGARENGLPNSYIRDLEGVEAVPDTDTQRRSCELAVYR